MPRQWLNVLLTDSVMTTFITKMMLFTGLFCLVSCGKREEGEALPPPPSHFPAPLYWPQAPAEKRELGRFLFHEPLLSLDGSISCASCHAQVHAFADHNVKFSAGIHGQLGTRNSTPLFNLAWHPHFMWDGGINHIEWVSLSPIENPVEMGETISDVIQKLQSKSAYSGRFQAAYGSPEVNASRILQALAVFLASLVSDNSLYDAHIRGQRTMTVGEVRGYKLFKQHCASCHHEPLFSSFGFASHGHKDQADPGRYAITQNPSDLGLFKIPSLRNLEFTYPYMHDGRFASIEAVLTDWEKNNPVGIQFSENERIDLLNFLKTLNDDRFTYASEFSAPLTGN